MELKSVSLNRLTWKEGKPIEGDITFMAPIGEIKLVLTPQDCQDILKLLSHRLVQQTQDLARNMTANIIESAAVLPALESKE